MRTSKTPRPQEGAGPRAIPPAETAGAGRVGEFGGSGLELWGGLECTVRRVRDSYFDQVHRSGHHDRIADLDRIAGLGVAAIRYPVLWERVAPDDPSAPDWTWPDERLSRLRELGVRPIVGLVHHGAGPRYTSLADPEFPAKLADYAARVAERYPWVDAYTPVNEPLTTARFSGLYGHWHPHGRSPRAFLEILVRQCRAVAEAMAAVRRINPKAVLVQTEDLGKAHSTPKLAYQAAHENERRWLPFDLLCGRFTPERPLWAYLRKHGIAEADLAWFQDNPCPPDVMGLNYYLTSERYLDDDWEGYPAWSHGGNGRHRFADVEAVRARSEGPDGLACLLTEAWRRFGRPLAVTEIHLGGPREAQLRWLVECFDACVGLRRDGVDLRAATVWSLLGSYDWNSLLTRLEGFYEPGPFDVRGPAPRPTALAAAVRSLADGRRPEHPVLQGPGWWRTPARLFPHRRDVDRAGPEGGPPADAPPLLIAGGAGRLGTAFAQLCRQRGLAFVQLCRHELDITDGEAVRATIDRVRPWAVVNAAGYVRLDDAETDAEACRRVNTLGPRLLGEVCRSRGIPLVTFSSHLVFDGLQDCPYTESDRPAPASVYGRSKADAEVDLLEANPDALVIRSGGFFGPWDAYNFVRRGLDRLAEGGVWRAAGDVHVTPTYLPDLVHETLDLLIDGESGVWHLANQGATTWFDFALRAAESVGVDAGRVERCPVLEFGHAAPRPRYSVLGSERGLLLPPLDQALGRFAEAWRASPVPSA